MNTWKSTTRAGTPFTLNLHNETIEWQDSDKFQLGIAEFFLRYNPLDELLLADQVQIIHELCGNISFISDTLQKVSAIVSFWKLYPGLQIADKTYSFQTKISDESKWKLHINSMGLTWHDLSNHYSQTNRIIEQNWTDFWFYGPVYPLPSLDLRMEIVHILKNALKEAGYTYSDKHFPLITYPTFVMGPQWEDGDYIASDFVILREYGVEDGRQNFHDGLVFLNFTSFEHCMTRSDIPEYHISKQIVGEIKEMISEANPDLKLNPV